MKVLRFLFQAAIVVAALVTGWRFAHGLTATTVETYCPFGGLEAAWALVNHQKFTCSTGEQNLALFVALIGLTLLSRKSFCGWVCPVGALSEWVQAGNRRLFGSRNPKRRRFRHGFEPSPQVDRALRWLRLPVLAVILFFTYRTGELVFRGYDPYYILFSANGHDVTRVSYIILAIIVLGVVLIPMAWCRYLCPLGIVLWPFSRVGLLRLERNEEHCTGCGVCDKVCPHSIDISHTDSIRSGECTLCFECQDACPEKQALELRLPVVRR